jgi:Pvc16 N-terminal domain
MSNPLAISAVTVSLLELLSGMTTEPNGPKATDVAFTSDPPDVAAKDAKQKLNVYLYRVVANAAIDNSDLPFRNGNGDVVRQPVSALTLRYLVSAICPNQLDAQHVLARAVRILHDSAFLTPDQIRKSITAWSNKWQPIAFVDLADQIESVRFSAVPMGEDDISKLWSAFHTSHRLSVVYEASAVLVERTRTTTAGPPVRRALVTAATLRRPSIEAVSPQFVRAGQTIEISGRNLRGDGLRVRFPIGPRAPQQGDTVSDTRIEMALPSGLSAGVTAVQVLHQAMLGDPPAAHRGFESNLAATVLIPEIVSFGPPGPAKPFPPPPAAPLPNQPQTPTGTIAVNAGTDFTLTVNPQVGREHRVELLLTSLDPARRESGGTRAIAVPPRPATDPPSSATLKLQVPQGTPAGNYLIQLRVDGAESELEPETDPARAAINPSGGPWIRVA